MQFQYIELSYLEKNIQFHCHFSYNFNLILTFHQKCFLAIYISPSLQFRPKVLAVKS